MKRKYYIALFLILILFPALLLSQAVQQRVPDPNTGNLSMLRYGLMDGNRISTLFKNWGEIAEHPQSPSCEWPKGTGHEYQDGVALVVCVAATDRSGKSIHPMETQYREFVDLNPAIPSELWGWAPLPGYFSEGSDSPAMSDDASTWPLRWPDKPPSWDGYWNGWFGKGKAQAELETYFVFDDDLDEEWDFYPDPDNSTRRGAGLEVAARYFQWAQVLARDAIFALYFITNEGKTDYDSVYFAFYTDWGLGDLPGEDMDNMDDAGSYDLDLDIAYAWDFDHTGFRGWQVGYGGFAFLESPGITYDDRDNDNDGLLNESRVNDAGVWLDQYPYGIMDVEAFKAHYGRDPVAHWSGDEDGDWRPYTDINGNGQWNTGEALNDDVGMDGLGPYDAGYDGPDEGEGDGKPTLGLGNLPGEPNFGKTDKDESDQIGLTGFEIFNVHYYELTNDEQNWNVFRQSRNPEEQKPDPLVGGNLGMFFASGPFKLKAGQTENYSMAILFADDLETLSRRKNTVQSIYNNDYRFAIAPDKPRLTVTPGDGRVILRWDELAENSWDPFLQEFDFEGYQILRSTEANFREALNITNAYGDEFYYLPLEQAGVLAQFDKINEYSGLHPVDEEGIKFNLGNNTGLRHMFIDTTVQNGQTYFYAVVSYDHGKIDTTEQGIEGLTPMWCTSRIETSTAGTLIPDVNCAIVTPNPYAGGYTPPSLDDTKYGDGGAIYKAGPSTGKLEINFVEDDSIKDGHTYEVVFRDTAKFHNQGAVFFTIFDSTSGRVVVPEQPIEDHVESPIFNGIVANIYNDRTVKVNYSKTGWATGSTTYKTIIDFDPAFSSEFRPIYNISIPYPADFKITFSNEVIDTSDAGLGAFKATPTKFSVWNVTEEKPATFFFRDLIVDSTLSPDTTESILLFIDNPEVPYFKLNATWRMIFLSDSMEVQVPPQPGDVYYIAINKPFRTGDIFRFTVNGFKYEQQLAKSTLDDVYVVPNPYVAAATWERKNPFLKGRGERRIWFCNLPQECTIRIYTVRGYLVDTIEYDGGFYHSPEYDPGEQATGTPIGAVPWNLVSKDGMDIAYGIYIYHIDAPGVGEHIGKFAVIK